MERREEEDDQELPPGFSLSRATGISPENIASPNMCNKSSSTGTNIRFIFRRDDINSDSTPTDELPKRIKRTRWDIGNSAILTVKTELSKKTKTSDECPKTKEANVANLETDVDILSFHGENGKVYTLSGPPKSPDLTRVRTPHVDAPSVVSVKNGLIQFIMEAGSNDVGYIITQANTIFTFLQGMNADYGSFYNAIRVYICHCLEWCAAEKELKKCKASEKLVAHHDQLVHRLNEMKKDVSVVEDDIERAKGYMAPLEARLQDMKEMVEKLELELDERRNDLWNLEARKADKMEEIAAVDVELKAKTGDAEKTRRLIRDNRARLEAARLCMEKARNELVRIM